jgi:hypothetical protein
MYDAGASSGSSGGGSSSGMPDGGVVQKGPPSCGLQNAAFCDTFDQPMGIKNRSGDLNGTVWGVSRSSGNYNYGSPSNMWSPVQEDLCGQMSTVEPENDVRICNGELVEAVNDQTGVTVLAMYPKQPFDIANRTGTVVFDVSDNTQGSHGSWPEFWYTDKPVPAPLDHNDDWLALPKDGLNIQMNASCAPNAGCGIPNLPVAAVNVGNVVVVDNYAFSHPQIQYFESVALSSGPGNDNHFELHISQTHVEVYGTDAGKTAPLKKMAAFDVNLSLTRGFIWMTDDHYNGDKFGTQRTNTFTWDNVGFDGPILPRDLAFDALDSLTPESDSNTPNGFDLGWFADPMTGFTTHVDGVSGLDKANGALLEFYVWSRDSQTIDFSYSINGNAAHVAKWPFPQPGQYSRTLALPVPLAEVQAGTNTISIAGANGEAFAVSNVDLVLLGGAGLPSCINPSGC